MIGGSIFGSASASCNDLTYTLLTGVTQEATTNVGITSNNSGYITNNSGGPATINGTVGLFGTGSTKYFEYVVATTSVANPNNDTDWIPLNSDFSDAHTQHGIQTLSKMYEYLVPSLPNGHSVGILVKTPAGTGAGSCSGNYTHQVADATSTPRIMGLASLQGSGYYYRNVFTSWNRLVVAATESSETIGVTTDGAGRITNNSGETQVVAGFMQFTMGLRPGQLFERNTFLRPYKNGMPLPEISPITYTFEKYSEFIRTNYYTWYQTELQDGDYIEPYFRSVFNNTPQNISSFQHSMRTLS